MARHLIHAGGLPAPPVEAISYLRQLTAAYEAVVRQAQKAMHDAALLALEHWGTRVKRLQVLLEDTHPWVGVAP